MKSFSRCDRLLSSASICSDDESLVQLQEMGLHDLEESRYGSGSRGWNLRSSNASFSRTMVGFGADSSGVATTLQYHSFPSGHGEHCQWNSETAEAIAGIPQLPSNRSYTSSGSTSLQNSAHSSLRSGLVKSNNTSVALCAGSTPQQVEDDDEDWNPIEDVVHRIKSKIRFLEKSGFFDESDVNFLSMAKGIV